MPDNCINSGKKDEPLSPIPSGWQNWLTKRLAGCREMWSLWVTLFGHLQKRLHYTLKTLTKDLLAFLASSILNQYFTSLRG